MMHLMGKRWSITWLSAMALTMNACSVTRVNVVGSVAQRDVWRGLTTSTDPVLNTEVVAVSRHSRSRQLAAGWFASRLMTDPQSNDIVLAAHKGWEVNRSNAWLEFNQQFAFGTLAIGAAKRLAFGDSLNPSGLPGATETYVEFSTAGAARLSHAPALGIRLMQDHSKFGSSLLQAKADVQPLLVPLPYTTAVRFGAELGMNIGGQRTSEGPRFESRDFETQGLVYSRITSGAAIYCASPLDLTVSFDWTLQQNIDPATQAWRVAQPPRRWAKWFVVTVSAGQRTGQK